MNKDKFIKLVRDTLRDNDVRKSVPLKKAVFHISDDDGNTADFSIKRDNKRVLYTTEDISNVIDACILVVTDALKRGEPVAIRGLGAIGVQRWAPRTLYKFGTDEVCEADGHYVPKFVASDALRTAARLYDASLSDAENALDPADYGYVEVDE